MDLSNLRAEIDRIDDELVRLFVERMEISAKIATYKKTNALPIFVPGREREKLDDVAEKAGPEMANYTQALYTLLFELSRTHQNRLNGNVSPLFHQITEAIRATPQLFPPAPTVACLGAEGVYGQNACQKMFRNPNLIYFRNPDGVFAAVESGLCKYGVLPVENSTAGTARNIYELLIRHQFSIVRSCNLNADHNLLANPGASLSGIKEIYSHQNAINQCSLFLQGFDDVSIIPVASTAAAARLVAQSGRRDVAAISGRSCMGIYGLDCLASSIQNQGENRTRFICFSKNPEIYPGSDITSLILVLPNRPEALYKFLARLQVLGIPVEKVESHKIADREFEMKFCFDLKTSIYSEEFVRLICDLEDQCIQFHYLGSYREIS